MQDTHWASGLFGYFPSYALGNIYSGQLLAAMEKAIPDWNYQISKGDFRNTKGWMIKNIYACGNLYDPKDLLNRITREDINPKHYINYLNTKYSKIYGY